MPSLLVSGGPRAAEEPLECSALALLLALLPQQGPDSWLTPGKAIEGELTDVDPQVRTPTLDANYLHFDDFEESLSLLERALAIEEEVWRRESPELIPDAAREPRPARRRPALHLGRIRALGRLALSPRARPPASGLRATSASRQPLPSGSVSEEPTPSRS